MSHCHKFRHYKKDCFKLKEKEKEDIRRKSQDEKSSVSVAEEASTSHEVFSVTVLDVRSRDEWFLIQVVLITYVPTGTDL